MPFSLGIITFPQAKNNELNTILDEIQRKIVLPAQLPLYQQRKIFRGRWKEKLELQPIELEIDDVKYTFKHIDGRAGDVPNTRVILWKAMDQMTNKHDWQILPRLMQALSHARKLKDDTWERVIQKASWSGHLAPVFSLAHKPDDDGLKLDTHCKAQTFLTGVVFSAAESGWQRRELVAGLDHAIAILQLLMDEGHKPPRQAHWATTTTGLSKDPLLLAVPTSLAAILVTRHRQSKTYGEMLQKYLQVLLTKWPENCGILDMYPSELYAEDGALEYLMDRSRFLTVAAPIFWGLQAAEQAVDADTAAKIASRRVIVGEEIASARAHLKSSDRKYGKTRGGLMMQKCQPLETKAKAEAEDDVQAEAQAEAVA